MWIFIHNTGPSVNQNSTKAAKFGGVQESRPTFQTEPSLRGEEFENQIERDFKLHPEVLHLLSS